MWVVPIAGSTGSALRAVRLLGHSVRDLARRAIISIADVRSRTVKKATETTGG
jgi:hypothetical protein